MFCVKNTSSWFTVKLWSEFKRKTRMKIYYWLMKEEQMLKHPDQWNLQIVSNSRICVIFFRYVLKIEIFTDYKPRVNVKQTGVWLLSPIRVFASAILTALVGVSWLACQECCRVSGYCKPCTGWNLFDEGESSAVHVQHTMNVMSA